MKIIPIIAITIFTTLTACGSVFADTWVIGIDQITPFLQGLNSGNNNKLRPLQKEVKHKLKVSSGLPSKNNKSNKPLLFRISERKTPPLLSSRLKKPKLKVKMQVVSQARIVGKTNGLPVVTVDYANKPLWNILQDVSNRTGYVFSAQGINLAKTYSVNGRFNLAELLSKLFANAQTTVNIKTKRIKIWR